MLKRLLVNHTKSLKPVLVGDIERVAGVRIVFRRDRILVGLFGTALELGTHGRNVGDAVGDRASATLWCRRCNWWCSCWRIERSHFAGSDWEKKNRLGKVVRLSTVGVPLGTLVASGMKSICMGGRPRTT